MQAQQGVQQLAALPGSPLQAPQQLHDLPAAEVSPSHAAHSNTNDLMQEAAEAMRQVGQCSSSQIWLCSMPVFIVSFVL